MVDPAPAQKLQTRQSESNVVFQSAATDQAGSFGLITPAMFISEMLVNLQNKYFSAEDNPEFAKVRKDIQYSLEKLNNKQSLFAVDSDLSQKADEQLEKKEAMMSSLQNSLQKMITKKDPTIILPPKANDRSKRRNTQFI